jgi:DNA invertase Pin-like site-specific DNA recombinase
MRVAYCRVSTLEQNTARQEIAMKELYVDTMFIEKASGKNTDRPELKKML